MDRATKIMIYYGIIFVLIIFAIVVIAEGPKNISRGMQAWYASGYGANWLIIHYAVDGTIINYWELQNAAVDNEANSDGICFVANGNVVHLSGSYVYVQVDNWELARKKFLKPEAIK